MTPENETARADDVGGFREHDATCRQPNFIMRESRLSRCVADHLTALHALAWHRALAAGPRAARHLRLAEHLAAEVREHLAATAAARMRAHLAGGAQ